MLNTLRTIAETLSKVALFLVALAVLLAFIGVAGATTPASAPDPQVVTTQSQGQSTNQSQGQSQGQSTDVTAGATANLTGNTQQVITKQVKQAPAILAAQTNTTAKCTRAIGASVSVAGFGVGGSFAARDRDCRLNEAADNELQRGNKTASIALRCQVSFYKQTFGPDCLALLDEQPPVQSFAREEIREALSVSK